MNRARLLPTVSLLTLALVAGAARAPAARGQAAELGQGDSSYVVKLASGARGGAYFAVAEAIADVTNSVSFHAWVLEVSAVETAGSVDNLQRLAAGEVNAALVQSDVLVDAWQGRGAFASPQRHLRVIGAVFPEIVHVMVRKDAQVRTVRDLKGKRIAIGLPGSGSSVAAMALLEAHGLDASMCAIHKIGRAAAEQALLKGQVDAWFLTMAAPSERVRAVLATGEVELAAVSEQAAGELASRSQTMRPSRIDRDVYPEIEAPLRVATVRAFLVVGDEVPEVIGAELARLLLDEQSVAALREAHPRAGLYDAQAAAEAPISLHAGALGYYRWTRGLQLPVKVHVGTLVLAVTNLDLKNGTFDLDCYLWFRWRGRIDEDDEDFPFEVMNGTVEYCERIALERLGGWTYCCYRVQATLRGTFLLHHYPFDNQVLTLAVESSDYGTDEVVFATDDRTMAGQPRDLLETALSPDVRISDWRIFAVAQEVVDFVYPTDFGSPAEAALGSAPYSRYVLSISLDRVLFPYVVKFCLPLVIIVLMAFMVFFIHPKEFEVQAGIVITALLSCVAFHLSQADSLPEVGYLVTADKFFILSYIVVFLSLVQVVIENHIFHTQGERSASRVDRFARVAFPLAFFAPIAYLIFVSR